MGYGLHTPEKPTYTQVYWKGLTHLVQAEHLEHRIRRQVLYRTGSDTCSDSSLLPVHSWKSCPTCPYLPSSHTPGSEPGTAPAEMHGTPSPPLCCLLCWFYTERFQEKNSIMWGFWRPRQREWRLVDFREKKLSAVSPSLTSPSDWRAFYALTLVVTPSDEVRTHPGQVLRATVHASSLIIVRIPRVASEGRLGKSKTERVWESSHMTIQRKF